MLRLSFIIPTYNAAAHIENCLKSIAGQDYPQDLVEILILDGGSQDKTLAIAEKYNCRIFKNEKKLCEYGIQIGMQKAQGDLVVIFAADNELIGRDWASKVSAVFAQEQDICAVWGRLASAKADPALNKYFELIQSDPLNWFLNKNLLVYKRLAEKSCGNWFKFRLDPKKPLVWGANGLTYRADKIKSVWARQGYLGDNDAFQAMIEAGNNRVAYYEAPFVYHHHVARLGDWVKKWRRNYVKHFLEQRQTRNLNWVIDKSFKVKLILWFLYSVIPVFSIFHALYLTVKDKNIHWLYHPLVSFSQAITYTLVTLSRPKGRGVLKDLFLSKVCKGAC